MKHQFVSKLIFSIGFAMALPVFCIQPQQLSDQQKTEAITGYFIKLLDTGVEKNILSISHLQRLQDASELINPMTTNDRNLSSQNLIYSNELKNYIEGGKKFIDAAKVKLWVKEKIAALNQAEDTRKKVHEDTREIHRSMRFVEIPAGKYIDEITHEEFEIPEGVEIQDTPFTQWQWMHDRTPGLLTLSNPSFFVNGPDAEEIVMSYAKIKLQPDAPLENVNHDTIQSLLFQLNFRDQEYIYDIPSVKEFQAVAQSTIGTDWITKIPTTMSCKEHTKTCNVTAAKPLILNGRRIWDIMGNVWQWTRDAVEIKNESAHLVFGGSYATDTTKIKSLKDIIRPILYDSSSSECCGLRLIRYKKSSARHNGRRLYFDNQLSWNEADCATDPHWLWDKSTQVFLLQDDGLRWMFEHKAEYPAEAVHTFDIILKKSGYRNIHDPSIISYIKDESSLILSVQGIKDISPLAYFKNLQKLCLYDNEIEDITPLKHLTKLKELYIHTNHIQDISALAKLYDLQELALSSNKVENIEPLENLRSLKALYLSDNKIQNTDALANFTNLQTLNLRSNQLTNINSLEKLAQLTDLSLENNHIQDISSLAHLNNLKWVALDNNLIKDLRPLLKLPNLHTVELKNNPLQDISQLDEFPSHVTIYSASEYACSYSQITNCYYRHVVPFFRRFFGINREQEL